MDRGFSTKLLNICISSLCKARNLERAEIVLVDGVRLGYITYNTLVSAYAYVIGLDAAYSILNRMRDASIRPNIITYNSLIAGAAKHRNHFFLLNSLRKCFKMEFILIYGAIIR